MKTSISDYDDYKNFCQQAATDDETFRRFRQSSVYTAILEHVSVDIGKSYIDWIKAASNFTTERLELSKRNDLVGFPSLVDYDEEFSQICPSTMRYLKVALELEQLFGSLDGLKIIEIGGGYGGQCKLINEIWKPLSYKLVDLQEPLNLSKRYIGENDTVVYSVIDELEVDQYDLVISNYAFSECSSNIQQTYIDKILKNSKNGYITYNNICHYYDVDCLSRVEFKQQISCHEMNEVPVTGDNIILYW
jgi:putative sugar O-methyltransferase